MEKKIFKSLSEKDKIIEGVEFLEGHEVKRERALVTTVKKNKCTVTSCVSYSVIKQLLLRCNND